ncbi:cell surface glycoprotein CD200 receptor 2 isoform X3 [Saimiri boliviensis]
MTQLEMQSQRIFLNEVSSSSCMDEKQMTQNNSTVFQEVNTSWPVLMGKNTVLRCPPIALKCLIIITWEIILRDQPSCKKAYRKETNETKETNCTDERITWVSRPDQNPALQIHPVAITHDGYYRCKMGAPDGNFHRGYDLQVLVTPEVTLFQSRNGTVVCKAGAGKPAAQISWIPEGDCVTEQKYWDDGTVTVKSTCHWEGHDVSTATCRVSHLTGNRSLSIKLNLGLRSSGSPASSSLLIILYMKFSLFVVILVTTGFVFFRRINDVRMKVEGAGSQLTFETSQKSSHLQSQELLFYLILHENVPGPARWRMRTMQSKAESHQSHPYLSVEASLEDAIVSHPLNT